MDIYCSRCGTRIEYDEGEGNIEDGWVCYECIKEMEKQIRKEKEK